MVHLLQWVVTAIALLGTAAFEQFLQAFGLSQPAALAIAVTCGVIVIGLS